MPPIFGWQSKYNGVCKHFKASRRYQYYAGYITSVNHSMMAQWIYILKRWHMNIYDFSQCCFPHSTRRITTICQTNFRPRLGVDSMQKMHFFKILTLATLFSQAQNSTQTERFLPLFPTTTTTYHHVQDFKLLRRSIPCSSSCCCYGHHPMFAQSRS
jgi:hypothetical protein